MAERRKVAEEAARREAMQRELEASRVEQLAWKAAQRAEAEAAEAAEVQRIRAVKARQEAQEHEAVSDERLAVEKQAWALAIKARWAGYSEGMQPFFWLTSGVHIVPLSSPTPCPQEIARLEAQRRHQQRLLKQMDERREMKGRAREELIEEGRRIKEQLAEE